MRFRNTIFKFGLCIWLCTFISCEFQPQDKYFIDLEEPTDAPELELEININDSGRIIYYWDSKVKLKLNNDNIKLHRVDFFLDGEQVNTVYDGNYYFIYLNIEDQVEHTLQIEFYTSTGSNSLADNIGAEIFKFTSGEWQLVPAEFNVLENGNTTLTDEGVMVNWNAYDGIGFDHYRILKSSTNTEFTITNNYLEDNEYLGENGHYYIYVVDIDGEETMWADCRTYSNLPKLKIAEVDRQPALSWNLTGYESKIESYDIYDKTHYPTWTKIGSVSPDQNYFIITNYIHGDPQSLRLDAVPKKDYDITNPSMFSSYFYDNVGVPGPRIDNHFNSCSKGFVYEYRDSAFYYSSAENSFELMLTDNSFFSTTSPNLDYFMIHKSEILELYTVDNFEFIKSVNISEVIDGYYPATYPKINDNGTVVMSIDTTLYLYDILNEELLIKKHYKKHYNPVLSPDGKYLILYSGKEMITNEIVGNTIVELNTFEQDHWYGYDDFLLIPDEPDKVYRYNNNTFEVRSMIDYSVQLSFYTGTYTYYGGVDFENNKVLIYNATQFRIYDFNTGYLINTIPTSVYVSEHSTVFCDNTIFTSGYKYYLN